ncbi:thiamine biosynthesis protein ThiC [Pontixanthobacter aquaemixtae]|uniref:Thiamine biosynthesis protein ThiC n=1 Tax=Pontixanthobacter aquaemixtae TaxID=1958940 RepID=A0A844ZWR1_9SPHN|nr:thiamine biosynthesis protein ThiC [Pontixanthobacter aquaemixtae]MXO91894.1 thiamine biosynthesis protein ThiC [Pontixanthobacter aquaemixtae]
MDISANRAARLTALLLILTVVTQIIYFAIYSGGGEPPRMIIWTAEAVAFLGVSVFALVALARQPLHSAMWAAIAMGGVLNVVQVGMGLAMFAPLQDAGEAMAPAFGAVLAGAFFLYFAGKFLFGFAAILIGLGVARSGGGAGKALGGLAALAGLAALLANLGAMAKGMDLVFPAGAAGTAATLLLALLLWRAVDDPA